MNKRLFIGGVLLIIIGIGVVFFFWKKPELSISETGSKETLPLTEDEILIQDPSYYLSKAQPYFQALETALSKKDYTAAAEANDKIHGFLVKMKQVSVVNFAQDQVKYLIDASDDVKAAILTQNESDVKNALDALRMMKVLQFQAQRQGISEN